MADLIDRDVLWYEIDGYPEYEITKAGDVRHKDGRIVKQNVKYAKYTEYRSVALFDGKQYRNEYVHRLVAKTFLNNPNGYNIVNHKDENGSNNSVDNLEWCTNGYNVMYNNASKRAADKKRGVPHDDEHKRKISQSLRKYYSAHESKSIGRSSEKRRQVDQFTLDGKFLKTFDSAYDKELRSFRQNIQACCVGRRKNANGFMWKYHDFCSYGERKEQA